MFFKLALPKNYAPSVLMGTAPLVRTQRGYTRASPGYKQATSHDSTSGNEAERFAYLIGGQQHFQDCDSLSVAADGVHIGHHTWLNMAVWGGKGDPKAWWSPPQASGIYCLKYFFKTMSFTAATPDEGKPPLDPIRTHSCDSPQRPDLLPLLAALGERPPIAPLSRPPPKDPMNNFLPKTRCAYLRFRNQKETKLNASK